MINKISQTTKNAIIRKSVSSLPDRPTESGVKAQTLKGAFYKFVTDDNQSVMAEIDRIVDELNNESSNSYPTGKQFTADSWVESASSTDKEYGKYYTDITVSGTVYCCRVTGSTTTDGQNIDAPKIDCGERQISTSTFRLYSNVKLYGTVYLIVREEV
jgi:hypothetical protein